jgi:hypothetical protein
MAAPARNSQPRTDVRHGVRAILTAAEGFHALDPETQRQIAASLVRISSTALGLAEETGASPPPSHPRPVPPRPLAAAQAAGGSFSGAAVDRIASTTQNILQAVSFPRFVGELITGVFKAMNDSNQQQLTAFVDLIRNVATTTEGFADANIGVSGARSWLAERFPGSFEVRGEEDDGFDNPAEMTEEERAEWQAERDANTRLVLRPGAEMPSESALRAALGLARGESLPTGDPEALVAPARRVLARNRQQMLATMVMMGMQRIVIDSGRLNASMRFHIDASSLATEDRGSRFDMRHTSEGGVRAQFGPWGASAGMQNTIGYVSTERSQSEEQINAELDLNSSVELVFRTDYVPLERLAGTGDVNRIRVNTINPQEEARRASEAQQARVQARETSRRERTSRLDTGLRPTTPTPSRPPLAVPAPRNAPSAGGPGGGATATPGSTPGSGTATTAPAPAGGGSGATAPGAAT